MDKEILLSLREKGKTYQDIADLFNVSRQLIWSIVNNYHSPNEKENDDKEKNKANFGGNKEKSLERDDFRCQICWRTQKECQKLFKRKLDTHHLNGNKKDNRLENLISVCVQCHSEIHQT